MIRAWAGLDFIRAKNNRTGMTGVSDNDSVVFGLGRIFRLERSAIFMTEFWASTTWNGNPIAQSPRKMSALRDITNTSDIRFLMVYRTIIDVILHLFIICNDLWCQLPFFSQTFRHNGSAVFGTMPPMCRSCPDVNKLRGMDSPSRTYGHLSRRHICLGW